MRRMCLTGWGFGSAVLSCVAMLLLSTLGMTLPDAAKAASVPTPVVGGIGGYSYVVKVALPLVYIGSGASIFIVDVSDPKAARLLGQSPIQQGEVFGIDIVGSRVYVAHGQAGLVILDVSNPASPRILSVLDTPGEANGLRIVGDTAYVTDGASGLLVIDVADPSAPRRLATLDTPGFSRDVQVLDNLAYVADMDGGLLIIDVGNPLRPTAISSISPRGRVFQICVVGTWVFVANGSSIVTVIDVAVPEAPREAGVFIVDGKTTMDLGWVDGKLFTVDWEGSMAITDVNLSTFNQRAVGSVETRGRTFGFDIAGDRVFIADGDRGLTIIDTRDPASPQLVGSLTFAGDVFAVTVEAGIACAVGPFWGLDVIDVSNPDAPRPLGSLAIADQATDVDMAGTMVYVTSRGEGLFLIDISRPASPRVIGTVDTPGMAEAVKVQGGHAFVADTSTLLAVAITDPRAPTIVGSLYLKNATDVEIIGDHAYVVLLEQGLGIVDISNPADMRWIGGLDLADGGEAVDVVGSVAYLVGGEESGLSIIDVSDPSSPTLLSTSDKMPRAWHVAVADGRAYVAAWLSSEGVFVIDVEDPLKPREVARWDTPGAAHSVFVDGGLAYVSDSGSGLLIVSTTARPPITATPTGRPITATPTGLPITATPTGLPITATPTPLPPRWRLFAPYLQH